MNVEEGIEIDRFQLKEDTSVGQRVLQYEISVDTAVVFSAESIGIKRIALLNETIVGKQGGSTVELKILAAAAPPILKQFAVFSPCATE